VHLYYTLVLYCANGIACHKSGPFGYINCHRRTAYKEEARPCHVRAVYLLLQSTLSRFILLTYPTDFVSTRIATHSIHTVHES
jgi:hypothetical protein